MRNLKNIFVFTVLQYLVPLPKFNFELLTGERDTPQICIARRIVFYFIKLGKTKFNILLCLVMILPVNQL